MPDWQALDVKNDDLQIIPSSCREKSVKMSLSKRSKFDLPLGKMDLLNDTKGIENLLKSEGITTYDPGYSLIKEELLNRKNRAELVKACGNIYPSAAAAAMDTGTLPQEWLPKSDNEVVDLTLDSVSDEN